MYTYSVFHGDYYQSERLASLYGGFVLNLEWTTEPPTEPGWYWMGDSGVVQVAQEKYPNGKVELVVYLAEAGRMNEEAESVNYYSKLGFSWLGPLPIPEKPE